MTVVTPKTPEDFHNLIRICEAIAKRDETFKFKVHEQRITVFSATHDQAHKRGMWLVRKTGVNASYMVPKGED